MDTPTGTEQDERKLIILDIWIHLQGQNKIKGK